MYLPNIKWELIADPFHQVPFSHSPGGYGYPTG